MPFGLISLKRDGSSPPGRRRRRSHPIQCVFQQALAEQVDQILIFGAGFDTRAIRFQEQLGNIKVFELYVPMTQQEKIGQYQQQHLAISANLTFIAIDFDQEVLPAKLEEVKFDKNQRCLFILEGLVMNLQPESVDETFRVIQQYAGKGSWVVFDYIYASVLRKEGSSFGETRIEQTVSNADEQWQFGIENGHVKQLLAQYEMQLIDHKDAKDLEKTYFSNDQGQTVGRINGTHCLVTAKIS